MKWIRSRCIFEGDEYLTEINELGVKKLVKHEQKLENINIDKIKGAYAIYEFEGEVELLEMTIAQIKKSWLQGSMNGNSGAHKNFTDEMCRRTVERRACKPIIRRADDSGLISGTGDNGDNTHDEQVKQEIKDNSGKDILSFDEAEEVTDEDPKQNSSQASTEPKKTPEESGKPKQTTAPF